MNRMRTVRLTSERERALRPKRSLALAAGIRFVVALSLMGAAGCRQEMATQPRYSPLQQSEFFGDDRSARPLEPGVVARAGPAKTFCPPPTPAPRPNRVGSRP